VSCPEFVGRADELDLLAATFERVLDGRAATILVGGEAGIGKTRLVEEFCGRARGRGSFTAAGVCVPIDGGGLPFGPVVGVLRDVARQVGEPAASVILGPVRFSLGLALPGSADPAEAYPGPARVVDDLAKTRLFEAILASIVRLSERSAVVLAFEDLQWADSASAELLSFLTRNLTDAKVLLVGTYRREELGRDHRLRPWLSELGRHNRVTHLRLEGLDRDEMARMIEGIVGHQPEWTLVDAVWARSQGNAFFAEELTATRHNKSLSPELQGVIMSRVESLSEPAQQLLRGAAAIGATADHELLVSLDLLDSDSLDGALAETVDRQILMVDPVGAGYRFRHTLLREAVYAALLPGERRRLHHRLATVLAAEPLLGAPVPGHGVAELAAHWWAAGEWAETLSASRAAAHADMAAWAFPEALAHLERALSAFDRLPAADGPGEVVHLGLLRWHRTPLTWPGTGSAPSSWPTPPSASPLPSPTRGPRLAATPWSDEVPGVSGTPTRPSSLMNGRPRSCLSTRHRQSSSECWLSKPAG